MAITNVQVLSMPVSDQDVAMEFYVGKLGLSVVRDDAIGDGARWLQLAPLGAATSMVMTTWIPEMAPGGVHGIVLESDDVDADCARLREQGVTVDGPVDMPWGRQATLTDPDGNGLVLSGFARESQ